MKPSPGTHRRGKILACGPQAGPLRSWASRQTSLLSRVSRDPPLTPRVFAAASCPEHGHGHPAHLPRDRGREPAEPEGPDPPGHRHPRGGPGAAAGGRAGPDPRQACRPVPLRWQGEPGLLQAPGGPSATPLGRRLPVPRWERKIPRAW